jgi:hypothetical protein
MKKIILILLLLSVIVVFAQNEKIEYNKEIPNFVLAFYESEGTVNEPKYHIVEINQLRYFLTELNKRENKITSKEFLTKPNMNTLVGHYLHKKLIWNSYNGPHIGIKKRKNSSVVKEELKNLPSRNELLTHYYLAIFSDVLNKQKPMNLALTNIDLDHLELENDTEKVILFLSAMKHIGGQVNSYCVTRFPKNCNRAKVYVENMPKFDDQPFYKFVLPEFEDFLIEVDKRHPKKSFKEIYLPEFEKAKVGYLNCMKN